MAVTLPGSECSRDSTVSGGVGTLDHRLTRWLSRRISITPRPPIRYNRTMNEPHNAAPTLDMSGWDVAAIVVAVVAILFVGLFLWFNRKP